MLLENRGQLLRGSRQLVLRNDIARKRVAYDLTVYDLGGRRIVDCAPVDISAGRVLADHLIGEQAAEVAAPELIEWDRDGGRTSAGIGFLVAFEGRIEEGPILPVVNLRQV